MASRRHIPPAYEERSAPVPHLIQHVPLPGQRPIEPLPPPELLENRLVIQAAEIQQLAEDNRRLAAIRAALREDLISARKEIQKLDEHIRSMRTESDIQIRALMDKISKMEVEIRAGESVEKDLQQAHIEARSLALARKELLAQIEQATWQLEKARRDVKKLPEKHAELDSLKQEHQRLRVIFEYEKGVNIDRVEKMQIMEKDIVGMAAELERLRAEVLNAEKRTHAPNAYGSPYISPPVLYPPPVHGNGGYVDQYGRPTPQMGASPVAPGVDPYSSTVIVSPPGGAAGAAAAVSGGGNPARWQEYDAMHARK